jgi:catechol 2,3-dioxygenase-like lactoylglutathione lyase family enzyme
MSQALNRSAFASSAAPEESLLGPLVYVFLDTSDLDGKRELLEQVLGLIPVETDPHAPHEHHGVIKYDAGPILVALNIASRPPVPLWQHALGLGLRSDDPAAVLSGAARAGGTLESGTGRFTDRDGHIFTVGAGAVRPGHAEVEELRLGVHSVPRALRFYLGQLGLSLIEQAPGHAVVSTGNLRLRLQEGPSLDKHGYLIVFHTPDLRTTRAVLEHRGVVFRSGVEDTEIGLTCRLSDPDHHVFCLYEPSEEALGWGAGAKIIEIAGRR